MKMHVAYDNIKQGTLRQMLR